MKKESRNAGPSGIGLVVVGLLAALGVSGCSAAARSSGMVAQGVVPSARAAGTVDVEVTGGSSPATDLISNQEFRDALKQSLKSSGPFSAVLDAGAATYRLDVLLFSQNHPVAGFALTSELYTVWSLVRVATGETVWKDSVQSKYTASFGDAFAGVERMRLAAEGAARDNIRQGIEKLASLKLG